MKTKIFSIILGLIFTFTVSSTSNAGVLMMGHGYYQAQYGHHNGGVFMGDGIIYGLEMLTGAGSAVTGMIVGGVALIANSSGAGKVAVGLIVLNENNDQTIASELAKRYPFIDDSAVIDNLASSLAEKFNGETSLVHIDEENVRSILAQSDLSDEEITIVINDLK